MKEVNWRASVATAVFIVAQGCRKQWSIVLYNLSHNCSLHGGRSECPRSLVFDEGRDSMAGSLIHYIGRRGRCVKHCSRTPADPGSIPGAGDKNKRLISLPCNIRRCAPRGSHIT